MAEQDPTNVLLTYSEVLNGVATTQSLEPQDVVLRAQARMTFDFGTRSAYPMFLGGPYDFIVSQNYDQRPDPAWVVHRLRVDGVLGPVTASALVSYLRFKLGDSEGAQAVEQELRTGTAGPKTLTKLLKVSGYVNPNSLVGFGTGTFYPAVSRLSNPATRPANAPRPTTTPGTTGTTTTVKPSPSLQAEILQPGDTTEPSAVQTTRRVPTWVWVAGGTAAAVGVGYGLYRLAARTPKAKAKPKSRRRA